MDEIKLPEFHNHEEISAFLDTVEEEYRQEIRKVEEKYLSADFVRFEDFYNTDELLVPAKKLEGFPLPKKQLYVGRRIFYALEKTSCKEKTVFWIEINGLVPWLYSIAQEEANQIFTALFELDKVRRKELLAVAKRFDEKWKDYYVLWYFVNRSIIF